MDSLSLSLCSSVTVLMEEQEVSGLRLVPFFPPQDKMVLGPKPGLKAISEARGVEQCAALASVFPSIFSPSLSLTEQAFPAECVILYYFCLWEFVSGFTCEKKDWLFFKKSAYFFLLCLIFFLFCVFCRDLAVIVASMAYNTWFTKLYCKDMRLVNIFVFILENLLEIL